MTSKNPKFYIDKKEMYDEIVKSNEKGRCSEELGRMFFRLAEKYSHHPMFRDYERKYGLAFKQDLISTGLHACVKAWDKFNTDLYDNPFSFFTTCLYRAFIGYLSKEYNYSNTKNALKVDIGLRGDYGYEEMIRMKEEETFVEDEEVHHGYETPSEEEGEEEDTKTIDFGVEKIEPEVVEKVVAKLAIKADHLDHMTLWGDDEEETPVAEVPEEESIGDMFGITGANK